MQTLKFNTTSKFVTVIDGNSSNGKILYEFSDVPTVKVQENYYEVFQDEESADGNKSRYPIARFPISATNMIISK